MNGLAGGRQPPPLQGLPLLRITNPDTPELKISKATKTTVGPTPSWYGLPVTCEPQQGGDTWWRALPVSPLPAASFPPMDLETLGTAGALAALIVAALSGVLRWRRSRRTLDFDVRGPLPLPTTGNEKFRWILKEDKGYEDPSDGEVVGEIYVHRIVARNTGRKPIDASNFVGHISINAPVLSGFVSGKVQGPSTEHDFTLSGYSSGRGHQYARLEFPTLLPNEELTIDLATRGWGVPGRIKPAWRTVDLSREPRQLIIDNYLNMVIRSLVVLALVGVLLLAQLLIAKQYPASINLVILLAATGAQLWFAYNIVRTRR